LCVIRRCDLAVIDDPRGGRPMEDTRMTRGMTWLALVVMGSSRKWSKMTCDNIVQKEVSSSQQRKIKELRFLDTSSVGMSEEGVALIKAKIRAT
ncbi:hypothetical protein Tco_0615681, partial [Tanacetum coccineum]